MVKNIRFFDFFFVTKVVELNKEKGFVEIDMEDDSLASNRMLFSPREFQETRFQKLVLPINSQTQKQLLQNDIVGKRMVIKHVQSEPTFTNLDEQTIKLVTGTFGTIEFVNQKNENPFDPLEPD